MVKYLFLLLSLLFTISAFGQNTLTVQQQLEDIDELEQKLKEVHPSLYRFCTVDQLNDTITKVKGRINKPNSTEEFSSLLDPIFLLIRDAHTWKQISNLQKVPSRLIPFDFIVSGDKLVVYNNCSLSDNLYPGTEILTINDEPSSTIINRLKNTVITDGYIETTKERVLEEWFKYIYKCDSTIAITYSVKRKVKTEVVQALYENEIDSIRITRPENKISVKPTAFHIKPYFTFQKDQNKSYGVLKIKWFDKIPYHTYTAFLDSAIHDLNKNGIENLIIDLRWNIGGPRDYPIYLLSKLMDQPFHYCKSLVTTKATYEERLPFDKDKVFTLADNGQYEVTSNARGIGLQQPSQEIFKGAVYLLVDGQSNSSSAQVASLIHHYNRGKIIGEEPGGLYDGGTGEHHYYLNLKNSKVKVQIPRYRIVLYVDDNKFKGHGVGPDFNVKPDVKDLLEGKDSILDFTIGLIKKSK